MQRQFQGQPPGPSDGRYASQILDHVIFEACQRPGRYPLLGLFVHPENKKAIRFYEKAGFTPFSLAYTDRATGATYLSMMLDLPVPPVGPTDL